MKIQAQLSFKCWIFFLTWIYLLRFSTSRQLHLVIISNLVIITSLVTCYVYMYIHALSFYNQGCHKWGVGLWVAVSEKLANLKTFYILV